jgi:sugar lactone lactonase YvrE
MRCILDARAQIGESPVWSAEEQALYWVDILAPSLNRLEPATGARHSWRMPSSIGCLALTDTGAILVALRNGLHLFDPAREKLTFLVDPEADKAGGPIEGNRYNDGKVSPDGRLFVGTMDEAEMSRPRGGLYRFDPDGSAHAVRDGLVVSNGLAWSADGRTLFHSDSKAKRLWRSDYDPETGGLGEPVLIAEPDEATGRPDGAATDMAGGYWSAGISAGVLNRWLPDGTLDSHIAVPCAAPTMPCFGGPDMRTIFITSARHHVAPDRLAGYPLSGGIFALQAEIPGVPVARFRASALPPSERRSS